MQILGIYINDGDERVLKNLNKNTWYGFNHLKNLHELFKETKKIKEKLDEIKKNQDFTKQFYKCEANQISLNAIVGKNGAGKSTLLDIYNRIINNFAWYVKTKVFRDEYNTEYELFPAEEKLDAELYYENNRKIYCIKVDEYNNFKFLNNENSNLFADTSIETLEDFSNHFFYTVSTNYSIYSQESDWINNLYHKNDGYFTPIVLVPFKENGTIIDVEREKQLAKTRVQTLSILLYKNGNDFIENYVPHKIIYRLKDEEYFKEHKYFQSQKITNYSEYIKDKITKLKKQFREHSAYENFDKIKKEIEDYWESCFETNKNEFVDCNINNYAKEYLKYKTLKICLNYEVISRMIDLKTIKNSISNIIGNELWNEEHLNYINLKIINCKTFLLYSHKRFFKEESGTVKMKTFLEDEEFKKASTFDKVFTFLLPDFYETSVYYQNKSYDENLSNKKLIQLSDMSSGEQQLYNSLSYVVYHIKNAQSNAKGNQEGQIPYKYFNLIFDEAELYYHPEYQRCFISNLIKLLNRSNLQTKGINITLVTHSPFILSDIPTANILALESGSPSEKKNETLGANIFDLLQSQFFMTSTIGECSAKTAKEIIDLYHSKMSNQKFDYSKKEFYRVFVNQLGDDYLRTSLGYMLDELDGLSFEEKRIADYKAKIATIQKKKK